MFGSQTFNLNVTLNGETVPLSINVRGKIVVLKDLASFNDGTRALIQALQSKSLEVMADNDDKLVRAVTSLRSQLPQPLFRRGKLDALVLSAQVRKFDSYWVGLSDGVKVPRWGAETASATNIFLMMLASLLLIPGLVASESALFAAFGLSTLAMLLHVFRNPLSKKLTLEGNHHLQNSVATVALSINAFTQALMVTQIFMARALVLSAREADKELQTIGNAVALSLAILAALFKVFNPGFSAVVERLAVMLSNIKSTVLAVLDDGKGTRYAALRALVDNKAGLWALLHKDKKRDETVSEAIQVVPVPTFIAAASRLGGAWVAARQVALAAEINEQIPQMFLLPLALMSLLYPFCARSLQVKLSEKVLITLPPLSETRTQLAAFLKLISEVCAVTYNSVAASIAAFFVLERALGAFRLNDISKGAAFGPIDMVALALAVLLNASSLMLYLRLRSLGFDPFSGIADAQASGYLNRVLREATESVQCNLLTEYLSLLAQEQEVQRPKVNSLRSASFGAPSKAVPPAHRQLSGGAFVSAINPLAQNRINNAGGRNKRRAWAHDLKLGVVAALPKQDDALSGVVAVSGGEERLSFSPESSRRSVSGRGRGRLPRSSGGRVLVASSSRSNIVPQSSVSQQNLRGQDHRSSLREKPASIAEDEPVLVPVFKRSIGANTGFSPKFYLSEFLLDTRAVRQAVCDGKTSGGEAELLLRQNNELCQRLYSFHRRFSEAEWSPIFNEEIDNLHKLLSVLKDEFSGANQQEIDFKLVLLYFNIGALCLVLDRFEAIKPATAAFRLEGFDSEDPFSYWFAAAHNYLNAESTNDSVIYSAGISRLRGIFIKALLGQADSDKPSDWDQVLVARTEELRQKIVPPVELPLQYFLLYLLLGAGVAAFMSVQPSNPFASPRKGVPQNSGFFAPLTAPASPSPSITASPSSSVTASGSSSATASSSASTSPSGTSSTSFIPPSMTSSATSTPTGSLTATSSLTASATDTATRSATPTASGSATSSSSATQSETATTSSTATNTASRSATATSSLTSTASVTASATGSSSSTLTASSTLSGSATSSLTATTSSTQTISASGTSSSSATTTASSSSTRSKTATSSLTATSSSTVSASPTATESLSATSTSTSTPSGTATSSLSSSATASSTSSRSATSSQTNTSSATATESSSATETSSSTQSATSTHSLTATSTSSGTSSRTATSSPTATSSSTASASSTATKSLTATSTPTSTSSITASGTSSSTPSSTASSTHTPSATASASLSSSPSVSSSVGVYQPANPEIECGIAVKIGPVVPICSQSGACAIGLLFNETVVLTPYVLVTLGPVKGGSRLTCSPAFLTTPGTTTCNITGVTDLGIFASSTAGVPGEVYVTLDAPDYCKESFKANLTYAPSRRLELVEDLTPIPAGAENVNASAIRSSYLRYKGAQDDAFVFGPTSEAVGANAAIALALMLLGCGGRRVARYGWRQKAPKQDEVSHGTGTWGAWFGDNIFTQAVGTLLGRQ